MDKKGNVIPRQKAFSPAKARNLFPHKYRIPPVRLSPGSSPHEPGSSPVHLSFQVSVSPFVPPLFLLQPESQQHSFVSTLGTELLENKCFRQSLGVIDSPCRMMMIAFITFNSSLVTLFEGS